MIVFFCMYFLCKIEAHDILQWELGMLDCPPIYESIEYPCDKVNSGNNIKYLNGINATCNYEQYKSNYYSPYQDISNFESGCYCSVSIIDNEAIIQINAKKELENRVKLGHEKLQQINNYLEEKTELLDKEFSANRSKRKRDIVKKLKSEIKEMYSNVENKVLLGKKIRDKNIKNNKSNIAINALIDLQIKFRESKKDLDIKMLKKMNDMKDNIMNASNEIINGYKRKMRYILEERDVNLESKAKVNNICLAIKSAQDEVKIIIKSNEDRVTIEREYLLERFCIMNKLELNIIYTNLEESVKNQAEIDTKNVDKEIDRNFQLMKNSIQKEKQDEIDKIEVEIKELKKEIANMFL